MAGVLDWEGDNGEEQAPASLCLMSRGLLCIRFWCRYAVRPSPCLLKGSGCFGSGLSFLKHAPDLLLLKAALLEATGTPTALDSHQSLTQHSARVAAGAGARGSSGGAAREDVLAIYNGALLDSTLAGRWLVQAVGRFS